MATIGQRNVLTVLREAPPGLYLDGGEHGEILLPNRYVPRRVRAGDRLEVFVYKDSQDRLVATTEKPQASLGEIATLRVVSINPKVGAFLDWGLAKDLLLPFKEQSGRLEVGQEVLVRIYLDERTERIAASMKLDKTAPSTPPRYRPGDPVEFVIRDKTPLGYKALVEGQHHGLLYHENVPKPLRTGETLHGYVRTIRPDGKIDLSLEQPGYRRVAPLAMRIVRDLQNSGGRLKFDDNSSPEAIRDKFGASKKSFKQALGSLYKARRIRFCDPGIELLDNSSWTPGEQSAGSIRKGDVKGGGKR